MEHIQLTIEGMSCGHCVAAVRRALEGVAGVQVEDIAVGSAKLAYDARSVTRAALVDAVEDAGYAVVDAA